MFCPKTTHFEILVSSHENSALNSKRVDVKVDVEGGEGGGGGGGVEGGGEIEVRSGFVRGIGKGDPSRSRVSGIHGRMARPRSGHGFLKVSPRPAIPYSCVPCGRATRWLGWAPCGWPTRWVDGMRVGFYPFGYPTPYAYDSRSSRDHEPWSQMISLPGKIGMVRSDPGLPCEPPCERPAHDVAY
jgi:hypothetical protein